MTRSTITPIALLAFLAACGPGENDPGPGGVTVGEAQALDEAAAMIEARKLPPEALDTTPVQEPASDPAAPERAGTEEPQQ
ncbi:hypothetical protein [Parerythrobacter jejuensis]|uniref:Lipoprotein n=1 Tax=Parerythrobacter jejuensis TaxID=795812 RepID=A0A845AYR6_9SPHN|nr:hypothetical protein [Parerythrobacter jejuensis]MXP31141.1 hypothetical protein [Parerythrobacter jejuensis]MXP33901.1 hypothetical protein [Parerythrobacter jejuensis]